MNDIFYSFNDKISLMLKTLRKEYERIIFDYNEDKLFKKCFPIRASKKCTKEQNLLITIMSSEKDMKNVTEIFRNII